MIIHWCAPNVTCNYLANGTENFDAMKGQVPCDAALESNECLSRMLRDHSTEVM